MLQQIDELCLDLANDEPADKIKSPKSFNKSITDLDKK